MPSLGGEDALVEHQRPLTFGLVASVFDEAELRRDLGRGLMAVLDHAGDALASMLAVEPGQRGLHGFERVAFAPSGLRDDPAGLRDIVHALAKAAERTEHAAGADDVVAAALAQG